jgi:hypothetical protein
LVRQLISETIADLPPQLDERLASFDVDVRLLGQEIGHHTHVDLRLALPYQGDGLRPELIEVGLQSLKELSSVPLCPGLKGTRFLSFFSVLSETHFPFDLLIFAVPQF